MVPPKDPIFSNLCRTRIWAVGSNPTVGKEKRILWILKGRWVGYFLGGHRLQQNPVILGQTTFHAFTERERKGERRNEEEEERMADNENDRSHQRRYLSRSLYLSIIRVFPGSIFGTRNCDFHVGTRNRVFLSHLQGIFLESERFLVPHPQGLDLLQFRASNEIDFLRFSTRLILDFKI